MSRYKDETIQVAAVAAAMLEDISFGEANFERKLPSGQKQGKPVLAAIGFERQKQDEKWGAQHHDPFAWLMILMEEVGELIEEVVMATPPLDWHPNKAREAQEILWMVRLAGDRARRWLEVSAHSTP